MNIKRDARILIVGAQCDSRDKLEHLLMNFFTNVVTVPRYAEAISELSNNFFDVIICDYMLDEKSGLDVRSWQAKNHPHSQFILLTGYSSDPNIVHYLETDHFKVLQKPADNNELIMPLLKYYPVKKVA